MQPQSPIFHAQRVNPVAALSHRCPKFDNLYDVDPVAAAGAPWFLTSRWFDGRWRLHMSGDREICAHLFKHFKSDDYRDKHEGSTVVMTTIQIFYDSLSNTLIRFSLGEFQVGAFNHMPRILCVEMARVLYIEMACAFGIEMTRLSCVETARGLCVEIMARGTVPALKFIPWRLQRIAERNWEFKWHICSSKGSEGFYWHIFWHSVWRIFWGSTYYLIIFWHCVWHFYWHICWHSYLAYLPPFYLAYLLSKFIVHVNMLLCSVRSRTRR